MIYLKPVFQPNRIGWVNLVLYPTLKALERDSVNVPKNTLDAFYKMAMDTLCAQEDRHENHNG